MFIQTEATPNPATMKFIPGREVLPGDTLDLRGADEAERSPLAKRLFAIDGVTGVFYGADFIAVTQEGREWQHLKPAILGAIMEHYLTGQPLLVGESGAAEAGGDEFYDEDDAAAVATIKELIETRVRPAVASEIGRAHV